MGDAPSLRLPLAARLLDGVLVGFAIFTLLANALVAWGGSLDDLMLAAGAAVGLAIVVAGARRLRRSRTGAPAPAPPAPSERSATTAAAALAGEPLRWPWLAGSLAAVAAGAVTDSITVWWACALPLVLAALARELLLERRRGPVAEALASIPDRRAASGLVLLALGLGLAAAVSIAHRSDADDSFYVNLAVAALDHPGAPLLAGDTLHGYSGIPFALPVFRVTSFELLQASLARIAGVGALEVAHVWLPPLVALLIPLAWARLALRLLPSTWTSATVLVVLGLLALGDGRAGYGDFAVLRLQQGKSVLLHVVLPLCAAYALELGRAPSRAGFVRLAAAQIAAVGLSATGLWLGPAVAGLGLAAALPLSLAGLARSGRVLLAGLAASLYPLALAASLRAATVRAMSEAPHPLEGAAWNGSQLMEHAADLVLGDGPARWLALFALLAATVTSGAPRARRFAAVSGAAFLVFFFAPFTGPLVANGLTGADTFFRVFWLIPLPLFVAALLTEPLRMQLPASLATAGARAAAVGAAAGLALGLVPRTYTLSPANEVRFAAPGTKLAPAEYAAARAVVERAGPDAFVLAPLEVARWIPLFQQHPRPLMVRELYLDRLHERLGEAELDRRRVLAHTVSGTLRTKPALALLAEAIDGYPLAVVCVKGRAADWPELGRVLRDSPLVVAARSADHEIWARAEPAGAPPGAPATGVP